MEYKTFITPLHVSTERSGIEWIDLIGELAPGLTLPREKRFIRRSNTIINIRDFFVERDHRVYMGYEWLNTLLAERAYEVYYKDPLKCFFIPRIITDGSFKELFITVDVFSYYMNLI